MGPERYADEKVLRALAVLESMAETWATGAVRPAAHIRGRMERLHREMSSALETVNRVAEPVTGPSRPLVGKSRSLAEILTTVRRIAPRDSNVLVTGESGTGKELVAAAVHDLSHRRDGRFVAVDCGSVSESLLESELFGHRKGAFTGALQDRAGMIEEASGGTLFLDELANSSPGFQTRLLRVLQESEVRRVGENRSRSVNVRVIAATSGNLEELVRRREFREDLFYRLNVVRLDVPPLRRRPEDITDLVDHFVARCCRKYGLTAKRFTEAALQVLLRYAWPGNVRELQNVVERSILLVPGDIVSPDQLPKALLDAMLRLEPAAADESIKTGEQKLVEHAILQANGDKTLAARMIGWDRAKLYRRLRQFDIPLDFGRDRRGLDGNTGGRSASRPARAADRDGASE